MIDAPSSKGNLPGRAFLRWVAGMLVGLAATGLLYAAVFGAVFLLSEAKPGDIIKAAVASIAIPSFVLVPAFGGLAASFIWAPLRPGKINVAMATLVMMTLGLALASLILHEGIICLIIISPLLYVIFFGGALIGRLFFNAKYDRLQISLLVLVPLLALGEPLTRSEHLSVVTDEIVVNAPPSKVWPCLKAFPAIPNPPAFWLFRIGLPYPQATVSEGDFIGAKRECIFSGNAIFRETIVELIPERNLTFDINSIPPDPELVGHLTPTRGQFLLRDNGDGTTTLTGSTWYSLHVRPLWYFELWTGHIFRAVHLRVMEDIKRRAEAREGV